MKLPDDLKNDIVNTLRPYKPLKVILFGSYASGEADKESDIDIYIVVSDNYVPGNFKEKMDLKIKFSKALNHIRDNYPVDLIVHTLPMHERFTELNSSFAKEILNSGVRLL